MSIIWSYDQVSVARSIPFVGGLGYHQERFQPPGTSMNATLQFIEVHSGLTDENLKFDSV